MIMMHDVIMLSFDMRMVHCMITRVNSTKFHIKALSRF